MKVFKIVLVGAIALSGYLGYSNFVDLSDVTEIFVPTSIEKAKDKERSQSSEKKDTTDLIIKIVQTIAPLGAPYLASRKRKDRKGEVKTLDDDIGDIAVHLGVSKTFVRGKLGLGDRRKKQSGIKKRRVTDIKSHT